MVNDADPVDLANSAGGATEMQVETKEGASLEVFDGEVTIASVGNVASERFIDGTDLLLATNDGNKYAVMDVTDTQYSNPQFSVIRAMRVALFSWRMRIQRKQEL